MKRHAAFILGLAIAAVPFASAWAGTGGEEFQGIFDWFSGLVGGTGGRLAAVIAIAVAIFASAVSMKFVGGGVTLGIVLFAAFGIAVVNNIVTAVV